MKREGRGIVVFDPSRPLVDQLLKELSILYIDSAPDIRPALKARREEAGFALEEIARNTSLKTWPREQAMRLLSSLGYPQANDVLMAMVKDHDSDLRSNAIELLAARGEEGAADVILAAYEQSIKNAGDPKGVLTVLNALVRLGDPRALPMLDEAIARAKEDYPGLLAYHLEEYPDRPGLWPERFKAMMDGYELKKRLVQIANSADPITPAIQILYERNGPREWALQFLKRKNPPSLAAHVRASYDSFKGMGRRWRERDQGYLHDCLQTIQACGGDLTASELNYLAAWEEGASPPALPD